MSAARRTLLTATAAGTLLGALWFVPSANATGDKATPAADHRVQTSTSAGSPAGPAGTGQDPATDQGSGADQGSGTGQGSGTAENGLQLADTGSVDTTPYLFGGTACLGVGAAFVAYSMRRGRATA